MDVVSMLNELYTKFDSFIDKHQVYKVSEREVWNVISKFLCVFQILFIWLWIMELA